MAKEVIKKSERLRVARAERLRLVEVLRAWRPPATNVVIGGENVVALNDLIRWLEETPATRPPRITMSF